MAEMEINKNVDEIMTKANTLIEALPYIRRFNGATIIVKYGGSAMLDDQLKMNVIKDVALLKLVGMRPIIVHGGGKEISKWVKLSGKEPEFYNGLRVTDKETMNIAEMVLNKVNKELVGLMHLLNTLMDNAFIPVIAPIGLDDEFNAYNINADDAACGVAKAMDAEKLVFLTDIEGVFIDPANKKTLISEMDIKRAKEFIENGVVGGGMLPKLNNCIDAIEQGVSRVHILDGRVAHCLLLEFFTEKGIGTAILKEPLFQVLYYLSFSALTFVVNFPPVSPEFHQRTFRVHLRNL